MKCEKKNKENCIWLVFFSFSSSSYSLIILMCSVATHILGVEASSISSRASCECHRAACLSQLTNMPFFGYFMHRAGTHKRTHMFPYIHILLADPSCVNPTAINMCVYLNFFVHYSVYLAFFFFH